MKVGMIAMLSVLTAPVWATEDGKLQCSPEQMAAMEAQFGAGSSAITDCLQVRKDIKTVMAINSSSLHKSGIGQQIANVKNYVNDLETYGLSLNNEFRVNSIGYGAGARWMLTDEAYNRSFGTTAGNVSRATVQNLLAKGVTFYMCQNTMKAFGWKIEDLLPGVKMVPSGVSAVVDFQNQDWTYLNP